jgi:hypothetical protein
VSVYANDFTDGLALQGIRLIFDNLEQAVLDGPNHPATRECLHMSPGGTGPVALLVSPDGVRRSDRCQCRLGASSA